MAKVLLTVLALAALPAQAQEAEHWDLSAPHVAVRFNAGLLRDMGVRLAPAGRPARDGYVAHEFGVEGNMGGLAPSGVFSTVESGELRLTSGPTLSFRGGVLRLAGTTVRPGSEPRSFVFSAPDGTPLFVADHQHHEVDRVRGGLHLFNLDLKVTRALADRLGQPRYTGMAVGVLEIQMRAAIPAAKAGQPLGDTCVADWGAPDNDVGLIGMGAVQQQARDGVAGLVAIAPSATLKNVGVHSVPWNSKFSGTFPPYNNDQHPMLIWNMYRVVGGAIQQIGASGMKHAFLTINSNCSCIPNDSHILFTGCEDVYSTGNNNDSNSLGPRSELTAHTGVWERCGSWFDKNCNNSQQDENIPQFQGAGDKRRLVVTDADLQTPGAQYFFEAWYVVRDDVNIFNTMGRRQVVPSFTGSAWTFTMQPLTVGPAIDSWVNPANPGPNADSQRLKTSLGHVTLAVRATDVGNGRWRYDYALMNHDFDKRIRSFTVPLPRGATVSNVSFRDVDRDPTTDWVANTRALGELTWQLKTTGARNGSALDWGLMDSFSFETDFGPSAVQGVMARIVSAEPPSVPFEIPILGPASP
jgi:hypothetical protein